MFENTLDGFWDELKRFGSKTDKQVRRPVIIRIPSNRSLTIGNLIFARRDAPDYEIAHEKEHIKQQKKFIEPTGSGLTNYVIRYSADKKFRFEQEKPAYRAEIIAMAKQSGGKPFNWKEYYIGLRDDYSGMATEKQIKDFIDELKALYAANVPE
jgi:hypothetical protein